MAGEAPEPFPIPGMEFVGLQNPAGTDDFTIQYYIKKALGARLGMKRSEISDDMLAIPGPLVTMLQTGPIAPPDGVSEEESTEPYSKTENNITEVLELFPSKKFDTIAKLTITNGAPMSRTEFIARSNSRIANIAKSFQIWALLHGDRPTTPFIFLGHGGETPGDWGARKPLPPGYTLVAFTQCGLVTYTDKIGRFLDWAKTSQDRAMSPGKHEKEIGKIFETEVRVYEGGDAYPPLIYYPLLHHNDSGGNTYTRASGFHTLPLIVENTMTTPMKFKSSDPLKLSDALSIYSGALYPSADQLVGKTMTDIEKVKIPIETILERFGPGVYYWPICRALEGYPSTGAPPLMRAKSDEQQQKRRTERASFGGKKKRRKTKRARTRRRY